VTVLPRYLRSLCFDITLLLSIAYFALTSAFPSLLHSSLTSVVCHEIAHSWMGNLITCQTWVRLPLGPSIFHFYFYVFLECFIFVLSIFALFDFSSLLDFRFAPSFLLLSISLFFKLFLFSPDVNIFS